ncbi:MAG: translation initiation factor IF-2, partial [Clostridium sp.]|nr:translation initiation factor IF-2 [Clostridium sp.]
MAKIKVHEIAKEMEKQSKEIIAFLQDKGIEVKAAQSSLEEEAAELVRKAFGKKKEAAKENGSKSGGEEKAAKTEGKASAKAEGAGKAEVKSEGKTEAKAESTAPAKSESRVEAKSEGTATGKSENKTEMKNESAVALKSESKTEVKSAGMTAGKTEAKAESTAPAKSESRAEAKAEGVAAGKAEAKSEGKMEAKTESVAPAKHENKQETRPGGSASTKSEGQAPARAEGPSGEQPRKKKKIIVVSNPRNSNIPGQRPQRDRRPAQGQNQGNRQGNRASGRQGMSQGQGNRRQEAPHKIIRPLTAPSMPESTQSDFKQNARRMELERQARNAQAARAEREAKEREAQAQRQAQAAEAERTARAEEAARTERAAQMAGAAHGEQAQQAGGRAEGMSRSGNAARTERNTRPEGTRDYRNGQSQGQSGRAASSDREGAARPERYQRNERTQQNVGRNQGERNNNRGMGRRPDSVNRPGNQSGKGDFRRDGSERNNNRAGGNNNRSERGGQGQDNRFRRPEKPGKGFAVDAPVKDEKRRDEEKRRISQERDKKSKKDFIYEEEDTAVKNKNKAGRFIKPEKKAAEVVEEQIKVITIPESLTLKELADKMKLQPSVIIKKLFLKGQIVTVNSDISFEDAENIAIEYDIICEKEEKVDVIEELLKEDEEQEEALENRPPVICVMGHVDHGKTSLLDAIRKTNVTDKEAGGITQHIGAYTVNINGQSITFLDTPGHEAFTAMRMRGANSTDIAILVVAADDGVMPQTVEAINHAKAAGIEIIVAVNKIDKPGANIDRVKQEMTEYELIPVDWGGSTEFVPVSAKTGEGLETLLETILLTAEILELKANPNRRARGLVIEAELDKGRGPVATVLVQKGTLHVGDFISAGASHGKVRAMIDDKGRRVKEATPSTPVEILGLSDVPSAGEVFIAHENDKTAKSYAETYLAQNKEKMLEETKAKMSLDDLFNQIQAGNLKELNIIVKADVQGSVEAVKQSLMKLSNEEIVVKCIHGGVGAINESDVSLASASSAIIIGFNVRPDAMAKAIAEREGVDIKLYKVIYQAIDDIEAAMKGMLDPIFEEKVIG